MSYFAVEINTELLDRLASVMDRETGEGAGSSHIGQAFHVAGAVYMGFIRERFIDNSRGSGDWEPLAESTLRGRRKGSKTQGKTKSGQTRHILRNRAGQFSSVGEAAILIDTATLIGSIGSFQNETIPGGIRVGVGSEVHYAVYHQEGTSRMPARPIFVEPDQPTNDQIEHVLERGYQRQVGQFERENQQ